MTPQERNLLIADTMGLIIRHEIGIIWFMKTTGKSNVTGEDIYIWEKWNPSENAEQRERIEDWITKQGYEIHFVITGYYIWCGIYKEDDPDFCIEGRKNLKSEAFLEAVGELCLTLKNQK